jgi:hypothetical protein
MNENTLNGAESNPVFIALYGFMATSILLTFDRMGIFEALSRYGRTTAESLAEELCLSSDALERVLQGAASWGLVSRDNHGYSMTEEVSSILAPNGNEYFGPLLNHFRKNTVPLFNHLGSALRDNKPQWIELDNDNGQEQEKHSFTHIYKSGDETEAFHQAMWRLSYSPSVEIVRKGLLGESKELVDLGGGIGAFSIAAVKENPDLKAKIFDLKQVKDYCEARINSEQLQHRISFVAGDFWQDQLPPADTYALGYILSDWDDEKAVRLLEKVHQALPKNGKIVVLERLLEKDRSGPFMGLMQDLAMMLETGGMHRPEDHYKRLLQQAGFNKIEVHRSSVDKHAIVGIS